MARTARRRGAPAPAGHLGSQLTSAADHLVGIAGIGGLGHMGVKLARALEAHVVAFTKSPAKGAVRH